MRRLPLVVALAGLALGLALIVRPYLVRERDYLAVTPQPPAVEAPSGLEVPADGRVCMNLMALDERSEEARLYPTTKGRAVPLELTIRGENGYQARGRAAADYRSGEVLAIPVEPPPDDLVASACVHNAGRRGVFLAAVVDRRRSRSSVYLNGTQVQPGFVIQFAERERVSILDRLPDSMRRMAVLRPAAFGEVTLWPLLALFVIGVPALGVWAYVRALREDE
jgi:hypothetical protein